MQDGKDTASELLPENEDENHVQGWRHVFTGTLQRADRGPIILAPFGLEWAVSSFFREAYHLPFMNPIAHEIKEKYIKGKRVLVVPAYSTNPYILKAVGAREVVGLDADEATVEWQRAIQQYFGQDEIGQDYLALANYPDNKASHRLDEKYKKYLEPHHGINFEKGFRDKIQTVISQNKPTSPLQGVRFIQAGLGVSKGSKIPDVLSVIPEAKRNFDFLFVPYLLGVKNGIESEQEVRKTLDELWELGHDGSAVMITPFSNTEEDMKEMFGVESGRIISELKNLIPNDKFDIERSFNLTGAECVLLKIKKP